MNKDLERLETDIASVRALSPAYRFWTARLRKLADSKLHTARSAENEFEYLKAMIEYDAFTRALEVLEHDAPTEGDARSAVHGGEFD